MYNLDENKRCADLVRALSIEMVESASSGHPGAPLGMADIATVLWRYHLSFNPKCPLHPDRDRFVLSNGHASALLYAVLHLSGYPMTLDDLKQFRSTGAVTAGHPEKDLRLGIETTSGPLGQGFANAVGMAVARDRQLQLEPDRINHYIWAFVGDGCLMEGVSHEAASLAGTLGLERLIVLYDANQISIDGHIDGWYQEDVRLRFEAYGWKVLGPIDGHDYDAVHQALTQAKLEDGQPVLVIFNTIIGKGIPDWEGQHQCHGQPLGKERALSTKKLLGFENPFEAVAQIKTIWRDHYPDYLRKMPTHHKPLGDQTDYAALFSLAQSEQSAFATRKASHWVLDRLKHEGLIGGSADLTASNLTKVHYSQERIPKQKTGNYINFGVREFAMAAIANGIALDSGLIPYVGTFLIFSDYAKNAIRMSALMELQVVYVLTHDSLALGEDGPTHQPVEQLAMLRATPNLNVWRPANLQETVCAWESAMTQVTTPTCMALSRQSVPNDLQLKREDIARGAYIVISDEEPMCSFVASGSEVALALTLAKQCNALGIQSRVISMPCMEVFRQQSQEYQQNILPHGQPVIAIEAGASQPWYEWAGRDGLIFALDRFGLSGPGQAVMSALGFDEAKMMPVILEFLEKKVSIVECE